MRPRKKKRKMSSAVKKYLAALKHAREYGPITKEHHAKIRRYHGV
jgi:hypothetical protein